MQNGSAYAVIVFPSDFTQSVQARASGQTSIAQENVTISLLADKSNVNVANPIIAAVNKAVVQTTQGQGRQPSVSVDASNAIYGANARFIDFFVPGIISVAVWQLTTLLTLISFVGERTSGTLFRLLASPLKESELVAGYAFAFGAIGTTQSAVLLAVGVFCLTLPSLATSSSHSGSSPCLRSCPRGSAYCSRALPDGRRRQSSFCPSLSCLHSSSLGFFGL